MAGVPVRDGDAQWLVEELEHDGGVGARSAALAIGTALARRSRMLALSMGQRDAILLALVDSPSGLDELRTRLRGGPARAGG